MRVLIAGCGYVGTELGTELVRLGHSVWGLRRSAGPHSDLETAGIQPLAGDITAPPTLSRLPREYDWVVNCVASAGGGAEEYRRTYLEGTRNLLDWLTPSPPLKFVHTSSTSVYGQNDGSLVTEDSPTEPPGETGRVLLETEQTLLAAARSRQFPAVILRVAGIYGPERGYWLRQYLNHEARIEGTGERFLNMIHRDDVAGVMISALKSGRSGEIYNAVDDEPVSQLHLFQWLAATLGGEMPPVSPADSERVRKRGVTNKRVSNQKLKQEFGYSFRYPAYRAGLMAELKRLNLRTAPP